MNGRYLAPRPAVDARAAAYGSASVSGGESRSGAASRRSLGRGPDPPGAPGSDDAASGPIGVRRVDRVLILGLQDTRDVVPAKGANTRSPASTGFHTSTAVTTASSANTPASFCGGGAINSAPHRGQRPIPASNSAPHINKTWAHPSQGEPEDLSFGTGPSPARSPRTNSRSAPRLPSRSSRAKASSSSRRAWSRSPRRRWYVA